MTKIHKARIKKWVAALRSGKFKQITGTQSCDEGYCCLGVAEKIFRDAVKQDYTQHGHADMTKACVNYYGLDDSDPRLLVKLKGRSHTASFLNDQKHWPFPRIANAIERTFLKD